MSNDLNCRSRAAICWLTADWVTPLIWPVFVKLSVSARSQKIFKFSICIAIGRDRSRGETEGQRDNGQPREEPAVENSLCARLPALHSRAAAGILPERGSHSRRLRRQHSSVVEQRFCKPSVVGSNPTAGSRFLKTVVVSF